LRSHSIKKRLRFVIVTVSTSKYKKKASNQAVADESGSNAAKIVRRAGHILSEEFLVSDDSAMIKARMEEFLSGKDDVAVFVGGTGVSPDDLTVETVRPYLEKELEGFGEIFRAESYRKIGPSAFLSRATAGTTRGKLLVCLPGSPDAVITALRLFIGQFPTIILSARNL